MTHAFSHLQAAPPLIPRPGRLERAPGVYWRPNEAFVAELALALQGRRVLEIFAGNGYLASCLAERGVDIVATSVLSGMDAHDRGVYHPVEDMDAVSAVLELAEDRDALLMCWPTVTDAALQACELWGDRGPIAYIGEITNYELGHLGGCATDSFFERFEPSHRFESYQGNRMEGAMLGALRPPSPQPAQSRRPKAG